MLYILKISPVTHIFKLNSLKSATKAIHLASFKEIQWQIILVWNVGLYLKECKISSKNVLFLPWKNCRQLNLLTISPRKESFPLQTLSLPFYFHLFNVLLKKVKNVDIFHEIDKKGYMSGCLSKPLTFFCLETYLCFLMICSMDISNVIYLFFLNLMTHFFLFHFKIKLCWISPRPVTGYISKKW
jgi:hypothetical protein